MSNDDGHPSLLWLTIPPTLLLTAYYVRKWYLARRLRLYGIGKGAPGFQTNVRRIRVTPDIAARIRRGETVSPEEIAKAAAEEDAAPTSSLAGRGVQLEKNEWLPEEIKSPRKKGKKR